MNASKIYFRDLLGLTLIIFSVFTVLGVIFGLLALLNNIFHENALAAIYLHESIPLLFCVIPALILSKIINRPAWVIATEDYRLQMAKKNVSAIPK